MRPYRFCLFVSLFAALATLGCSRSSSSGASSYETRKSSGDVSFRVTPKGMDGGKFVVELRADTHSGDLSEIDLKNAVTLVVDDRTHKPSKASSLRGHHASGSIAFDLPSAPKSFEIRLSGVRGMGDIQFHWP